MADLWELAAELRQLEVRRVREGLPLREAQLCHRLHETVLERLTAAPMGLERRLALRVPCEVEIGGRDGSWQAANFGPGGIGITGEVIPQPGARVALEWIAIAGVERRFPVEARVSWRDGRAAGLAIDAARADRALVVALYAVLLEAFLRDGGR